MPIKVDFYLLTSSTLEASGNFIGRLLEKIYKQQLKTVVYANSAQDTKWLDDLLWAFNDISFVPHTTEENNNSPILITSNRQTTARADVLVNLCSEVPAWHINYQRIVEITPNDATIKQQGRIKYRTYQKSGCQIDTHKIT